MNNKATVERLLELKTQLNTAGDKIDNVVILLSGKEPFDYSMNVLPLTRLLILKLSGILVTTVSFLEDLVS